MDYKDAQKRLSAAQTLFLEPGISRDKLSAVRALLQGVHPQIDTVLSRCDQSLTSFEKISQGHVMDLAVEHMPENTEEEKSRKKLLLLFVQSWNSLKSEVARVQAELSAIDSTTDIGEKTSSWGRIFNKAKGPFGVITLVAAGIVLTMQQTSVSVLIENQGCETFQASGSMLIALPGLSLPDGPIASGETGVMVIPPLSITVDTSESGIMKLKALTFNASFELPNNLNELTFDGKSLLGGVQEVRLSEYEEHRLVITCR